MTATLVLPPKLDTAAAGSLQRDLLAVEGDAVIDGAAVTHIGGKCLQVLVVACADAVRGGRTFRFEGFPDAIIEHLQMLGFTPESLAAGDYE